MLSRALRFRVLTGVDAVGVLAYYGWAVGWVLAGAGVWALATGVVFKAALSTVAMAFASRSTNLLPSFRGARSLLPVISFGLRFQGISVAGMLREQGLNVGIAGLSGVGTLGLWTLAKRVIEIPVLIIEPLHRVAFPYMSQLQAAREDPGPVIERGIRVTGTAAGVVLTALAASASGLVPGVFGEQWSETAVAVQWVCVSLIVAAPLAVVAVGFLYATGEPSVVLRATIAHTLTLFAVAFPLLPFIGVNAIGAGSLAGAVVDAVLLGRAVSRRSSARPFRLMAVPLLLGVPAGLVGSVVTHELGNDFLAGVAGGSVAGLLYLTAVFCFRRATLLETGVARPALGPGRSRPGPRGADPRRPAVLAQKLVEHAGQVGHEPGRAAAQQDVGIRLGRLLPATPAVDLETDQLCHRGRVRRSGQPRSSRRLEQVARIPVRDGREDRPARREVLVGLLRHDRGPASGRQVLHRQEEQVGRSHERGRLPVRQESVQRRAARLARCSAARPG